MNKLQTVACRFCNERFELAHDEAKTSTHCPNCRAELPLPPPEYAPGRVLGGDFELKSHLGSGSMGHVFLAQQLSLDREVAVKIVPMKDDGDETQRFLQEMRLVASLLHPNIVTAYAAGQDGDTCFLAMSLVPGDDLEQALQKDGPLDADEVLEIISAMAKALGHAWDTGGILHRDVKPSNIKLTAGGDPVLLDLGIAKRRADNEQGLTMAGFVIGTPHYMSPEQARGNADLDFRTDVYSLGATAYHLATGQVPFESDSVLGVLTKHITDPFPDPRSVRPDLPENLAHLILRMCAKEPTERPESWAEVDKMARRALAGEAIPAPGSQHSPADTAVGAAGRRKRKRKIKTAAKPAPVAAPVKAKGSPLPAFFTVLVLGALVAVGGYFMWQKYNQGGTGIEPGDGPGVRPLYTDGGGTTTRPDDPVASEGDRPPDPDDDTEDGPADDPGQESDPLPDPELAVVRGRQMAMLNTIREREIGGIRGFRQTMRDLRDLARDAVDETMRSAVQDHIEERRQQYQAVRQAALETLAERGRQAIADGDFAAVPRIVLGYTGPFARETATDRQALFKVLEAEMKDDPRWRAARTAAARKQLADARGKIIGHLFAEDFPAIRQTLSELAEDPAMELVADECKALRDPLRVVLGLDRQVMETFRPQLGKPTKMALVSGVVELTPVALEGGVLIGEYTESHLGKVRRKLDYNDLHPAERLRRLVDDKRPETDLLRGAILAGNGRPDLAAPIFRRCSIPLAKPMLEAAAKMPTKKD